MMKVITTVFCASILAVSLGAQVIKRGTVVSPDIKSEDVLVLREFSKPNHAVSGTLPAVHVIEIAKRINRFAEIGLSDPAGVSPGLHVVDSIGGERTLSVAEITAAVPAILGLRASTGKMFGASDSSAAIRPAVITDNTWRTVFGGQPGVVFTKGWISAQGKREEIVIVGVLAADASKGIELDPSAQVILLSRTQLTGAQTGERWYSPVLRLKKGISAGDLQKTLDQAADAIHAQDPKSDVGFELQSLRIPKQE
jgi:hypothetical protein